MSLKAQITEDMKTAMRAKDSVRLGTIRLLLAAMKQKEVDERIELVAGAGHEGIECRPELSAQIVAFHQQFMPSARQHDHASGLEP